MNPGLTLLVIALLVTINIYLVVSIWKTIREITRRRARREALLQDINDKLKAALDEMDEALAESEEKKRP